MKLIFLDGESKGGKTAVGRHITRTLEDEGCNVRLIVSGNFFRTVTFLVLKNVRLHPTEEDLLQAAVAMLGRPELNDLYDDEQLQTPEVDALVSRIGSFDAVQTAVVTWRWIMAKKALDDGVDILIFDGRNLRRKMHDWLEASHVPVILELIIYCRPEVAAQRYLAGKQSGKPTAQDLEAATAMIYGRRQMDRQRSQAAYTEPVDPVKLVAGVHNADEAMAMAFKDGVEDPPRPIIFDNSDVTLEDGLSTVAELAKESIKH